MIKPPGVGMVMNVALPPRRPTRFVPMFCMVGVAQRRRPWTRKRPNAAVAAAALGCVYPMDDEFSGAWRIQ
jgi:hypothetical protein